MYLEKVCDSAGVCESDNRRLPGAKCAAVGAYVVERRLSRVRLLFPLPFVDDELPLEVGQELEVFLLLRHTHHLKQQDGLWLSVQHKITHLRKLTNVSWYLQFSREQTLKLLLQREGESEPAHVGGLPALPEVHHTLEVFLGLFVLLILCCCSSSSSSSSFTTFSLLLVLLIVFVLHGHPVSKQSE